MVRRIALALVVLSGLAALWIYQWVTTLESVQLTDDIHVIRGFGGNVAVLRTATGAVVVDSMTFRLQGARLRDLASQLADAPPQVVLNTHYHRDHTHGNPGFAPGIRVVATEKTLAYLSEWDADYWLGEAEKNLPNETFRDARELVLGGKTLRLLHPGPAHTGGDMLVLFVEDRVLHTGDLVFHRTYPRVDLVAGASLPGWIAALDRALELEFDQVIPGHGEVTDRQGVIEFQAFLREVWGLAEAAAREGMSLDDLLDSAQLDTDRGYRVRSVPFLFRLDRESVLREAWQEATGAVRAAPVGEEEVR